MVNAQPNFRAVSFSLEHADAVTPDGPLRADLEAARSRSIVAPLAHLTTLRFAGEDAETFLQGQLSCDVSALSAAASYGAYCTPQGRMLASFLLWRGDSGFFIALATDIAAGVQQRLSRFVLRARVKIAPGALALAGCSGPDAPAALLAAWKDVPAGRLETRRGAGDEALIRLDESRFLLALATSGAEARIGELSSRLTRVASRAWEWLDVRRGIPWITSATQDRLVPQMANLERIGGVSFAKGCYTGQEVVARAQHRGTVKRRMFLASVNENAAAGDELYAEDLGDQAAGVVVNAAPSPDGGTDLLAVAQAASRESSTVHLRSLAGPVLRFLPDPAA
jgi:tRNA-modifying protein YgfZ